MSRYGGDRSSSRAPRGPSRDEQAEMLEEIMPICKRMVDRDLQVTNGGDHPGGGSRESRFSKDQEWLGEFHPFQVDCAPLKTRDGYTMQSFNLMYYKTITECICAVLTGCAKHIVFTVERFIEEISANAAKDHHRGVRQQIVNFHHKTLLRVIVRIVDYLYEVLGSTRVGTLPPSFVKVKVSRQGDPNDTTFVPSTVVHVYLPTEEITTFSVDFCVSNILSTFAGHSNKMQTANDVIPRIKACCIILACIYHPWITLHLGDSASGGRLTGGPETEATKVRFRSYLADAIILSAQNLNVDGDRHIAGPNLLSEYSNEGATEVRIGILADVYERIDNLSNRLRVALSL